MRWQLRKVHTHDFADLEKIINRKLRAVERSYGIRNLHRTPNGRYGFELKLGVDPRHESRLHEILREVLRELPADRAVQAKYGGVTQSALVAECLTERL